MVLLEPPAPAALVELGLAFATLSFWSAAARRRIAVLGPPGGVGDDGRPLARAAGGLTGEEERGEDYRGIVVSVCSGQRGGKKGEERKGKRKRACLVR